jgi:hypothetical protein
MTTYRELLLTVVLVALIITINAGSIRYTPERKQAICSNNLRQIYAATISYCQDHDGTLPLYLYRRPKKWTYWYNRLLNYIDSPSSFYCPSHPKGKMQFPEDQRDERDELLPVSLDDWYLSYGMNSNLAQDYNPARPTSPRFPFKLQKITNPGHVVGYGDSNTWQLRANKWNWSKDYLPCHEGRFHVVFMDGTVRSCGKDNLSLMHAFDGWSEDTTQWSNWKD